MGALLFLIPALVGLGIWGYAIKRLGFLLGLSVGWFPAGIGAIVIFYGIILTLGFIS